MYKQLFLMKDKVVLLVVGFFVICLTSCLGNDNDYTYVPSGDAQVYRFHLQSDSVPALDSVLFAIDNLNGQIYNPDSMDYGTVIKDKVICSISTRGVMSAQVKQTALSDTLSSWNTIDSLDFSKPVEFVLTSMDGVHKMNYTAQVNIHTVNPDSIDWQLFTSSVFPKNYTDQITLVSNDSTKFLMYVKVGDVYSLRSAPLDKVLAWTELPLNDFPEDAQILQMTYYGESLLVAGKDGKLYRSVNGTDWKEVSHAPYVISVLGEIKKALKTDPCFVTIAKEGNSYFYYYTSDLEVWIKGEEIPDGFPISGFGRINYSNMYKEYLLIMAGKDKNGSLINDAWITTRNSGDTSYNLSWIKSTNLPPFKEGREGIMLTKYDDKLYVIGGMNKEGKTAKDISYSVDYGLSWHAVDSLKILPQSYAPRAFSSIHVDKNNYLLIFGGKEKPDSMPLNQIWKGRINRLGFKIPYKND